MKPVLSVVIPVYDRLENLKICLDAIGRQYDVVAHDLELIVVDDGSTDKTKEYFTGSADNPYVMRLKTLGGDVEIKYFSGGPNKGFRGGRARNIGSFNANGERLVFIDSDVVINEHVLGGYIDAHKAQPNAIIVGMYHWLPPIIWKGNYEPLYSSIDLSEVLEKAKALDLAIWLNDNNSPFGLDVRHKDYSTDLNALRKGCGLGALSGNISYPAKLFWELGGFDERIVGHGGEDADLGLTADEAKADWLFYQPLVGFHLWHPRDQEKNAKEVQANIAFIDAKHGIGQYAGAKKWTESRDFSDPIHYHRHIGAFAMKLPDDPTVFVARADLMTRIGISTPQWLAKLGFSPKDILIVDREALQKYEVAGSTK